MSRPRWQLRDAALGYASRGIPVLPLHYPLPHRNDLQPVRGNRHPAVRGGCWCRDPGCGQVGKHPLGSLVPHGVKDATCNRARILAWWTRHPQANIGLATGHRFDVLDIDGPTGAQTIQQLAATHGLQSCGPLVRTGGGGWHYYLAPAGLGNTSPADLEHVDWRGRGGYAVAPPSRHATGQAYQWVGGRDLDTPPGHVPAVLWERLQPRQPQRPTRPLPPPALADHSGDRYARAALAEELARVAGAPVGQRNRQLWESTRNLYNLVATGALDQRQVDQGLLAAAERCGLLTAEPRQTQRTLASGRQVGLAHPRHPPPDRAEASPAPPLRAVHEATKERGDGHGRRRPAGRLTGPQGVGACRRQAEPAPTQPPAGRSSWMGSHPSLAHHQQAAEALELGPDDWIHNHHRMAERTSEQAFDRLNPTFGVPADTDNPIGHNDVRAREAAFALGVRVGIHNQRQNDPTPIIWQAGQDYRMADALHAARTQPTRTRHGPERLGPER